FSTPATSTVRSPTQPLSWISRSSSIRATASIHADSMLGTAVRPHSCWRCPSATNSRRINSPPPHAAANTIRRSSNAHGISSLVSDATARADDISRRISIPPTRRLDWREGEMSRVVLMCGPAGSGKTTRARALENEGFVRLSIDTEAWARGLREQPLPDEVAVEIETHLRNRLIALIREAADVVVDYSFWSRRKRSEYRDLIEHLGSTVVTLYVDTPRDVALARVADRSGSHVDEVVLT